MLPVTRLPAVAGITDTRESFVHACTSGNDKPVMSLAFPSNRLQHLVQSPAPLRRRVTDGSRQAYSPGSNWPKNHNGERA